MSSTPFHFLRDQLKVLGSVFALTLLAAMAGALTQQDEHLAALWPVNAVVLGAMVRKTALAGPTGWLAFVAALTVSDMLDGLPLHTSLFLTAGNVVSVGTACFLFSRLGPEQRRLAEPKSLIYMTAILATAAAAAGMVGAVADPVLFKGTPASGWAFWFVSELVNYIAVLPMILTLPTRLRLPLERRRDASSQSVKAGDAWPALACIVAFGTALFVPGPGAMLLPIPLLLWCALSYRLFTSAVLTCLYVGWVLISYSNGYFLLESFDPNGRPALLSIRFGLAVLALTPLLVASITSSRNELLRRVQHLAAYDQLSGLLNRRAFEERMALTLASGAAQQRPVAMLMLDIDHFKSINDGYGHAAGDAVIVAFSALASACVRNGDLVGRVGGEEFAVLLPDCGREDVVALAERIRAGFAGAETVFPDGNRRAATVSIGIAFSAAPVFDIDSLMRVADDALYRAKKLGRNRVEVNDYVSHS